ncbi:MAG TPA: dihydrodipicolinate synthase family protein [Blastocatellia bacterium]|nr:dihydrodipicolinate synthase family protein [Blastocatellia bacterium]
MRLRRSALYNPNLLCCNKPQSVDVEQSHKNMGNLRLNGIMPPLTTPFTVDGSLDLGALRANVSRYNQTGLAGYVALGSNGEAVHLSSRERGQVIETIKLSATDGHTIVAGVNELSTRAAIEATAAAANSGAEAALVITPYFYKASMTAGALSRFYTDVADQSPIPVLIYNVPQNTGVVIDSATVAALAEHQNIAGVKDSSGNMGAISDTIRRAPASFAVMTGNGGILYPSLAMGARGAVLAVACAAPKACVDLFQAVQSGDHTLARDLQSRLAPLSHAVTAGFGVAGLKAAMEMTGLAGGEPRAPLTRVSEADSQKIRTVLRETGLFPDLE